MKSDAEVGTDGMATEGRPRAAVRLGFMGGGIDVPEDFDRMGEADIEETFRTSKAR